MMQQISIVLAIFHIATAMIVSETPHPNVIIMHVNNLHLNDLGIHVDKGDSENSTPNIDRLAYGGVILNRFYANGGADSLYSGCYQRSQYGNRNLMKNFFERNNYDMNFISLKNYTKSDEFQHDVISTISKRSEPLFMSVNFGTLNVDVKISFIDEVVGGITMKAHREEIIDNTIIIFISLPLENIEVSESSPLESNIRRIAFIYSPQLSLKQSISNQLFHVIDILPTLVNATHLKWRTRDRYFMDGVNQWTALNTNEEDVRNTIYGDNFYISNNWKLSYGTTKNILYDSISNLNMENDKDNYDFNTYIKSITSSDVNPYLEDLPVNKIMLMRNRAKIHCNKNDIDESFVINIKCSRASPCLFDLQNDPCELDDKHEPEFDLRRSRMVENFDRYLESGIIEGLAGEVHHPPPHGEHPDDSVYDPILSPGGGFGAFLTLGVVIVIFVSVLLIVVCVKERCNSRRSVYIDKSKKVTFKDESGASVENELGISTISGNVNQRNHH